jgi:hypothetical protein
MTQVFNTHIEAARYLLEKPMHNQVTSRTGLILIANDNGDYFEKVGAHKHLTILRNYISPFTAVEPEKSKEDYLKELCKIWDTQAPRDLFQRQLEIMDEKIKKAKV